MKSHLYVLLTFLITLSACEEIIEVALPNPEGKLVVEGEINSGLPAIVTLSHNMAYFDAIDSASIANMYITDSSAILLVSDGITTDTLRLMTITRFPYIAYVGANLIGEVGKTYTLNISYQEKSYQATTSIPEPANFSNIWFEQELTNDSIGMIGFSIDDNGNTNDYYAISSLVIGEQWWYYHPIFGTPVFDDIRFNGDTSIILLPRSYEGNDFTSYYPDTEEGWDSLYYYRTGESVSLRLSTIDQEFYLWWNSLFRSGFTGSNPYSNPSTILSNIEGDPALGVWGGYSNTIANVHITDEGKIEALNIEDILPQLLPDSIMDLFNDLIENIPAE